MICSAWLLSFLFVFISRVIFKVNFKPTSYDGPTEDVDVRLRTQALEPLRLLNGNEVELYVRRNIKQGVVERWDVTALNVVLVGSTLKLMSAPPGYVPKSEEHFIAAGTTVCEFECVARMSKVRNDYHAHAKDSAMSMEAFERVRKQIEICLEVCMPSDAGLKLLMQSRLNVKTDTVQLKLKHAFSPVAQENAQKRFEPGTRKSVTEHFHSWLGQRIAGTRMGLFFLEGAHGCGKSTLLAQWVHDLQKASVVLVAHHFFQKGDGKLSDACLAFSSLAYQLCRLIEGYEHLLEGMLVDLLIAGHVAVFRTLLLEPLLQLSHSKLLPHVVLVLDALDEAGHTSDDLLVNTDLRKCLAQLPIEVIVVFSSTLPPPHAEHLKRELWVMSLEAKENIADVDMATRAWLQGSPIAANAGPVGVSQLAETIVDKSHGMFQYASMAYRMLCQRQEDEPEISLDTLLLWARTFPTGLGALYREYTKRVFAHREPAVVAQCGRLLRVFLAIQVCVVE